MRYLVPSSLVLLLSLSPAFGQPPLKVPNLVRGDLGSFLFVEEFETACTDNQVLKASSGAWTCGLDSVTTPGAAYLLGVDTVRTTVVSNSATETVLYSVNLPGGTLGTDRSVRMIVTGAWTNNTVSDQALTVRVKFGGVTIYSDQSALATPSAIEHGIRIDLLLNNSAGDEQSAVLTGDIDIGSTGTTTTGAGDLGTDELQATAIVTTPTASTVDNSSDRVWEVTVQMSTGTSGGSVRRDLGLIEVPAGETDPEVPLLDLAAYGDVCAGGESVRRNVGDTANECFTSATGGGEANTYSSLGGGLAVIDTKVGVDLPFSSFDAADFDLASNLFAVDASITRDSEVPSLETDPGVPLLALADLGDLCAGGESTRRNVGDTANECFTPGSGGGAFSDAGDPIVQNTTTKDVHIGDGATTLVGKLEVGGDADQPQLIVEGFSTQTDSLFIVQTDAAGAQLFTVDNDGTTTVGGSTGLIQGNGTAALNIDGNGQNTTLGDGGTNGVQITDAGAMTAIGAGTITATGVVCTDCITLTTETAGNYVLDVADGTGIDGTAAGEGATYTPVLDLTEVGDLTWGDNTDATVVQAVDPTGTTNPAWSYTDGVANLSTGNLQEGGVDLGRVGSCTNQFVRAVNGAAAPTCATVGKADSLATVVYTDQANTYTAGQKQTFVPSATLAGLNITLGTPSAPVSGDIWLAGSDLLWRDATGTRTAERLGNKNAASGYAGLTAGTKLTLAQGQEVWALADLTDIASTTGTGTAAVKSVGPALTGVPTAPTAAATTNTTQLATTAFVKSQTREKCINIPPGDTITDWLFWRTSVAITVTAISCITSAATSVVLTLRECDANGGSCAATEAAMTCTTTNTPHSGGIDDAAIDAGDWIRVLRGTVSGSPPQVSMCMYYTLNG